MPPGDPRGIAQGPWADAAPLSWPGAFTPSILGCVLPKENAAAGRRRRPGLPRPSGGRVGPLRGPGTTLVMIALTAPGLSFPPEMRGCPETGTGTDRGFRDSGTDPSGAVPESRTLFSFPDTRSRAIAGASRELARQRTGSRPCSGRAGCRPHWLGGPSALLWREAKVAGRQRPRKEVYGASVELGRW